VELLTSPSGWHRQTAHRLLIGRQDRGVIPQLREMAMTNAGPLARVNALWVLESLSTLDDPLLLHALHDAHPGVREHALRMAEPFLGKSPAITNAALGMIKDPDARVEVRPAPHGAHQRRTRVLTFVRCQPPSSLCALAGCRACNRHSKAIGSSSSWRMSHASTMSIVPPLHPDAFATMLETTNSATRPLFAWACRTSFRVRSTERPREVVPLTSTRSS
jgi:hypothetical protein